MNANQLYIAKAEAKENAKALHEANIAAIKAAGIELRFVKTQGTFWRGNGFGTESAEWNAEVNGEVVAEYRAEGHPSVTSVYGRKAVVGTGSVTGWRQKVAAAVAAKAKVI